MSRISDRGVLQRWWVGLILIGENRVANANFVTSFKKLWDMVIEFLFIDERAIGAAKIGDAVALPIKLYHGMMP